MKITIIAAALPPQLDGIGDYTAKLASELAKTAAVSVLTCGGQAHFPLPGVRIVPAFSPAIPASCAKLMPIVQSEAPDWVILQYQPFAYGKWGYNTTLPLVMRQIKRSMPHTRIAVMVHEPFVLITDVKNAVMTTWQRWQLWHLGQTADVLFFSIDVWTRQFRRWFPSKIIEHLPVGSNIPHTFLSRQESRKQLGIADTTIVLGIFGTAHASRLPAYVRSAAHRVRATGREVVVLYLGPHGQALREALGDTPLLDCGRVATEEVSVHFAAIDIYLAPFVDGVSTRRSTLMTALQHGIATVGTFGCNTDTMLMQQHGKALLLTDVTLPEDFDQAVLSLVCNKERRDLLGKEGQLFFQHEFTWEQIAERMCTTLTSW